MKSTRPIVCFDEASTVYSMRRLSSLLSTPIFFFLCVSSYTVARFLVTSGKTPMPFPDSIGYETLRFFGENDRFWSVPLAYSFTDVSQQRVLIQSMAGCLAWIYFAYVVQSRTRYPRILMATIFLVGLTPQVVRYDIALLSESLGMSFTVAAVASAIQLSRHRNNATWMIFVASVTLLGFTRPTHLVVVFVCAAIFLGRYIVHRRKTSAISVVVFLVLSLWGVNLLNGNAPTSNLNFYTILQQRIIKNDAEYKWFVDNGMPDIPGVRESRTYTFDYLLDKNVAEIVQLPEGQQPPIIIANGGVSLAEWVRDHGWSTYASFLIVHPAHVAKAVNRLVPPALNPGNDNFLIIDARTVTPRWLFGPWWMWIGLYGVSLTWAFLFLRQRREVVVLALMGATGIAVFLVVILCSAVEIQRHATSVAVLTRVLALATIGVATAKRTTTLDESADANV